MFGFTTDQIAGLRLRSPLPASGTFEAFAAKGSDVIGVTSLGEVVISNDDGQRWRSLPPFLSGRNNGRFLTFSDVVATPSAYLLFTQERDYLRTTDLITFERKEFVGTPASISLAAFGGGKVIAADFGSRYRISEDEGVTWTNNLVLPDGISRFVGLEFGLGRFVGLDQNDIVSSTDGQTWTAPALTLPEGQNFRALSFARGLFFALGDSGLLYTSDNGTAWTERATGTDKNLRGFVTPEPGGGFLIHANFVGAFHLSADLNTLTESEIDTRGVDTGLRTDSGAVVVGRLFGALHRRAPGTEIYTDVREQISDSFDSVAFGSGMFVTVDNNNGRVFTSTDGTIWTLSFTLPQGQRARSQVIFENGTFVFMGSSRNAWVSPDGVSWQEQALAFAPRSLLEFLNGEFVAFGFEAGEVYFYTSENGLEWSRKGLPNLPSDAVAVDFGNNIYLANTFGDNTLWSSPDLVTWTSRTVTGAEDTKFNRTAFGGGRFLAVNTRGRSPLALSTDGINWQVMTTQGDTFVFTAPGYQEGLGFYLSNGGGLIFLPDDATAADGQFGNAAIFPSSQRLTSLAEGNGVLVGVTGTELLSTSLTSPGYEAWAMQNFSASTPSDQRSPFSDADRDGRINLVEYAVGSSPEVADGEIPLTRAVTSFGPEYSFSQVRGRDDLQGFLETSLDLQTWSSAGILRTSADIPDNREIVTGRITGTRGQSPNLYVRARWNFGAQ